MKRVRAQFTFSICVALLALSVVSAWAGTVEVFHADSLAGPMKGLKAAFETKNKGVTVNLTSGVSRQLADRILNGDTCDVFVPSSPAVADDLVMKKGAAWYVIFSANE